MWTQEATRAVSQAVSLADPQVCSADTPSTPDHLLQHRVNDWKKTQEGQAREATPRQVRDVTPCGLQARVAVMAAQSRQQRDWQELRAPQAALSPNVPQIAGSARAALGQQAANRCLSPSMVPNSGTNLRGRPLESDEAVPGRWIKIEERRESPGRQRMGAVSPTLVRPTVHEVNPVSGPGTGFVMQHHAAGLRIGSVEPARKLVEPSAPSPPVPLSARSPASLGAQWLSPRATRTPATASMHTSAMQGNSLRASGSRSEY